MADNIKCPTVEAANLEPTTMSFTPKTSKTSHYGRYIYEYVRYK